MTEELRVALERMALERMETAEQAEARVARNAALLARHKAAIWRERLLSATRAASAGQAFEATATPAVRAVEGWIGTGCQHALVLRGGVGTGKTMAACVAVKHWVEPDVVLTDCGPYARPQKDGVVWLRPDDLVSAIMHAYDERSPRVERYVVIDDMGRETRGEFVEALCELFDRRDHAVLITTNLNKAQMRERYSDIRLRDRMNDRARAFDIPGDSMRRNGGDF